MSIFILHLGSVITTADVSVVLEGLQSGFIKMPFSGRWDQYVTITVQVGNLGAVTSPSQPAVNISTE